MTNLHAACPFDGRKLRKIEAYDHATTVTQRTCAACKRRLSLTIQPIYIESGTAHVLTIAEKRNIAGA